MADSFLQSAKLAIRETAQLVWSFCNQSLDRRFQKFASWLEAKPGPIEQALRDAQAPQS
jgi:hypothetical protein